MLHNLTKFCSEADIQLSDIDADFWLALDRAARIEFVRAWWLDHDDKGFTSMTGADACAEFFHSKQNSIRGLQTEAFKGVIAPWQKGYVSGWREVVTAPTDYAALESRAVGHMLAEAKDEASQQAALKFLGEAGLPVEQAQEAFKAVTSALTPDLASMADRIMQDEYTRRLTDAEHAAANALMNMAEQPAPETKAKTQRQPKAPKPPKRAPKRWVRINGELHPATPGAPICVCPSCKVEAFTHEQVALTFSIRYENKDRTKPGPQSLCGTCRTKSAREKRERDRAQLPVPSSV
jgi:hypothetical protein